MALGLPAAAGSVFVVRLPSEAVMREFDRRPPLLALDVAAALLLALVVASGAIARRPLARPVLLVAGSAASGVLLADALVGSSGHSTIAQPLGEAASPLLPGLVAAVLPVIAPAAAARWRRATMVAAAIAAVAAVFLHDPFQEIDCRRNCVPNPMLVAHVPDLVYALQFATAGAALGLCLLLAWRALRRHAWGPVVGAVALTLTAARLPAGVSSGENPRDGVDQLLHAGAATGLLVLAVAVAYELARVPRLRLRVLRMVHELRPTATAGLQHTLRQALDDQTLRLTYVHPTRNVALTRDGAPAIDPEEEGGGRTEVRRGGRTVAVLHHEPSVVSAADVLGPAATLALDNERLTAAHRYDLEILRHGTARLVELGDDERRRIERDLHDGAQQMLVAVVLSLRLLSLTASSAALDEATADLTSVVSNLRRIAHGIHPAVLTNEGLEAALEGLADEARCSARIRTHGDSSGLPEAVAITAYATTQEALGNAATAGATAVEIELEVSDQALTLRVRDDGPGGAHIAPGGGLEALRDRAVALRGTFEVQPRCLTLTIPSETAPSKPATVA